MKTLKPSQNVICNSIDEVVLRTGLGRTSVYSLIKQGRLKATKIGRRTLISEESLLDLFAEEGSKRVSA